MEEEGRDETLDINEDLEIDEIKYPDQLNRIDLQCIFEFLYQNKNLPSNLNPEWVHKHFSIYNEKLCFIKTYKISEVGDPPEPPGVAILLEVLEYENLLETVKKVHESQDHASVGTTMRKASQKYWHPELILAAHEDIHICRSCQLMRPPDPSLGNPRPIQPPPPLTWWGIDHTLIGPNILLSVIEYATGWLESRPVPNADFSNTIPLLLYIYQKFGTPKQIASDNANCFSGNESKRFQEYHNFNFIHTTPSRPQGNGKVEQANGVLKNILTRIGLDNTAVLFIISLNRAVATYNRRISPTGYSPFFLLFGAQPPERELMYSVYTREPTDREEQDWADELVKNHEAPIARSYANSVRAARAKTREYLQESKALMRTFTVGDWVLRVRQRKHKFEPFYDGPWAIASCHPKSTYSLISPGRYKLLNNYNGTNLFPAYTQDGHPIQSLWYGSKSMLAQDRKRLKATAGL